LPAPAVAQRCLGRTGIEPRADRRLSDDASFDPDALWRAPHEGDIDATTLPALGALARALEANGRLGRCP
jgi:hypothetical protein